MEFLMTQAQTHLSSLTLDPAGFARVRLCVPINPAAQGPNPGKINGAALNRLSLPFYL